MDIMNLRPFLLALGVAAAGSAAYGGAPRPAASGPGYAEVTLDELKARIESGGDTTFVVNLWATWCAPCIKEMPYFDRLQDEMGAQGVKVLLVSLDAPSHSERALKSFLARRAPSSEVLHLNEDKPHVYIDRIEPAWSGAIPATLVWRPSTGTRTFHEGELDFETLQSTVQSVTRTP